ncbi:MAG: restriction endonuclease subunit S [Methanoregula sp.]|nr:restriction endonuclease subunit S [Methanoregula sp.]
MYDGVHGTPSPSQDGPVFLGIKNLTDDGKFDFSDIRHISEEEFARWTKRILPKEGDVVFTYEATLHRYAIIPRGFRGCLGRRLALIKPDNKKIVTKYLFYYFFSEEWRNTINKNIFSGATVDRIPIMRFPNFEITVPPLPTQRKIAAILSAYDDLIENNTRRIRILEEMAQAIYREWFVHFRFPGHEGVRMVESELGLVPEGWEVRKLGDVLELSYGKGLKAEDRKEGNVPVFGSSGLVGYHDQAIVEGPGIVVGRKGNVGSIYWSDIDFYPIDTVYYVKSKLPLHYIFYNLQKQNFLNNDAAVPGLNRNQAYSLPFLVPDSDTLIEFEKLSDIFFNSIKLLECKITNLRRTRDLLLPKLISGELDVSGLDIQIPADAAQQ